MKRFWLWLTRDRPTPSDPAEAEAALKRACDELERIDEQWPVVENLQGTLRTLREKNHFIEGFRKTL